MKKVLMSLFTIAIVGALIGGGTFAYFSDTETSTGNTFQSGTIDFEMDNGEGSAVLITLTDMKPCDWAYYQIRLHNVGTNDGPLYLHFDVEAGYNAVTSEPETAAGGETINDIENHITVDLSLTDVTGGEQYVVIAPKDDIKLGDLDCLWIPLGWFGGEPYKYLKLSFHLQAETGNEYQGDAVDFTINAYMTDHNSPGGPNPIVLFLENKDASWNPIVDSTFGYIVFDSSASTFKYTLYAYGLQPSTSYNLIYYCDPWPNNCGVLIGTHSTGTGGNINGQSGNVNLNMDLPVPADANFYYGAKIWLILASDGSVPMTGWHPSSYLFETNLIKYDDTDV
jgi:spore coat-associated protein N